MSTPVASLPASPSSIIGRLRDGQTVIALVVIGVLLVMVVPLPTFAMDLLLATNIAISLAVLLTAFYAQRPLEFAIFPGLLLVTTLFRLSLNVASTRLILGQGEAGALILAFGNFVVSGNYVVGAIIFIVLVIINFVVITKGSGRIAEVGARFTLDAMPGKQMAIDADLNAGIIDEVEAKQRRSDVSREADFYGSMDGASKFVRGDAMAGLIITGINIVGGLVIGMTQFGLSAADSAEKFMLLSIGDGLVSQIPALLISTAAGIIVTRASSDNGENLSDEVAGQLFKRSQPIVITGAFLLLIGMLPGLPGFPFWALGLGLLFVGRGIAAKQDGEDAEIARKKAVDDAPPEPEQQQPVDLLLVDPLELEIDYALISLVDPNQNGDLLERVKMLRQQLALELGLVIPPIRIRDNVGLNANQYVIKLRGNPIGQGEVLPGYHLALLLDPDAEAPPGIHVEDPTFGLPAVWVSERNLPDAERLGLTVIEAPAVITTHLLEVLRGNAHRLLDRQETKKLTEKVKETNEALIDELIPNVLPLGQHPESAQKATRRAHPHPRPGHHPRNPRRLRPARQAHRRAHRVRPQRPRADDHTPVPVARRRQDPRVRARRHARTDAAGQGRKGRDEPQHVGPRTRAPDQVRPRGRPPEQEARRQRSPRRPAHLTRPARHAPRASGTERERPVGPQLQRPAHRRRR